MKYNSKLRVPKLFFRASDCTKPMGILSIKVVLPGHHKLHFFSSRCIPCFTTWKKIFKQSEVNDSWISGIVKTLIAIYKHYLHQLWCKI